MSRLRVERNRETGSEPPEEVEAYTLRRLQGRAMRARSQPARANHRKGVRMMNLLLSIRSLWRFCRGRCPVHNARYADAPDRSCAACMKEFGPDVDQGSRWD